jgi:hypothetical protein
MNNPKDYLTIRENTFTGPKRADGTQHTTFFISAGPENGTPVILIHG